MKTLDLVCLGVGRGTTYIWRNEPSSALALLVDGQPELLLDCGSGIVQSCLRNLGGVVPYTVYISHNHDDHAGDIGGILFRSDGRQSVMGHPEVLRYVKEYRMHDAPESVTYTNISVAEWCEADAENTIHWRHDLSFHLTRSVHAYLTYGFVLRHAGVPIFGWSADSAYNEALYTEWTQAPVAVLDGNRQGSSEHASFADIDAFAKRVPHCQIGVIHHAGAQHTFESPNVRLLREGDVIRLYTSESA